MGRGKYMGENLYNHVADIVYPKSGFNCVFRKNQQLLANPAEVPFIFSDADYGGFASRQKTGPPPRSALSSNE
jgi:hypothetical protein